MSTHAYTGTPLIAGEDGATVPLFYENRTPELELVNPDLNEIAAMRALGLDIEPHRRRMRESDPGLGEKFKDTGDPLRRDFLGHERLVSTLYKAIKPDPAALEFAGQVACISTIADAIKAKLNPGPADISQVMGDIHVYESYPERNAGVYAVNY